MKNEKTFKTEQESFWAGKFGNEYVKRNQGAEIVAGNLALFSKILSHARKIESLIEFGSNIGLNLIAAEYYNPTPVSIPYRGHRERLFKRDFAGEMLDRFPDLRLVNYGFSYHRDSNFPQDDTTWFLLEK